jgi:hypothetical protein
MNRAATPGECVVKEWGDYATLWLRDYPDLPFTTHGIFPHRYHVWFSHLIDSTYGNCRRCGYRPGKI